MNRRIEDEIKDIVQNAVHTRDFRQLNRDIGNTVNSALSEVRRAISYPKDQQDGDMFNDRYGKRYEYESQKRQNRQNPPHSYTSRNNGGEMKTPVKKSKYLSPNIPIGRISGVLLTVFGSVFSTLTGIAAFVLFLTGVFIGNAALFKILVLIMLPLFLGSVFMLVRGSQIRQRLKRFKRYLGIIQNRSYYPLKELSAHVGQSSKFVLKDLKKMIFLGMFSEGHIDDQETCLILNHESYQLYLDLQKSSHMKNSNQQPEVKDENMQSSSQNSSENTRGVELKAAIENGRACIRQIKSANDAIPGEEISAKLYQLEAVIEKIFNHVELHPQQLPEIQKFMDYYLPTTLKLVNTYKNFDNQPLQGENITSAKHEIEDTLDTINLAFEKLFDNLFSTVAMDVSTDISVLETLLAQEGLMKSDFKQDKSNLSTGGLTND